MDICGFETHGKKQLGFVAHFGHRGELDARTVRSQTADDPAALLFYKRIRAADGGIQDLTVENAPRSIVSARPCAGGRRQGLGLTGNLAAMVLSQSDIPLPPQAA